MSSGISPEEFQQWLVDDAEAAVIRMPALGRIRETTAGDWRGMESVLVRFVNVSEAADLVWHYTTTAGLRGMLVDHKLRATSVSFVNDPTEQQFGTDAVLGALTTLEKDSDVRVAAAARTMRDWRTNGLITLTDRFGFSERYVACASVACDSLDLWRGYGAHTVAGTFAIGLDRHAPLGLLLDEDAYGVRSSARGDNRPVSDLARGWNPMEYRTAAELEEVAEASIRSKLAELDADNGDRDFQLWSRVDRVLAEIEAGYKHRAYSSEGELRLQAIITSSSYHHLAERSQGISAFVELTSTSGWGDVVTSPGRLPVREIITWPGAPAQALRGVAAALHKGGHTYYGHPFFETEKDEQVVHVRPSEVPFV